MFRGKTEDLLVLPWGFVCGLGGFSPTWENWKGERIWCVPPSWQMSHNYILSITKICFQSSPRCSEKLIKMKKQRLRGGWGLERSTSLLPQAHTLLLSAKKPRIPWPAQMASVLITSLSTQSHLLTLYHVWACWTLQAWIQTTGDHAAAAALSTVCENSRLIILMET